MEQLDRLDDDRFREKFALEDRLAGCGIELGVPRLQVGTQSKGSACSGWKAGCQTCGKSSSKDITTGSLHSDFNYLMTDLNSQTEHGGPIPAYVGSKASAKTSIR